MSGIAIEQHAEGYRLACEMRVACPLDEVFEFFSDAHQLQAITPDWLHFQVLTPRPIDLCEGTLIDYRLKLHGIPVRWRTRISLWDPPFRFVDEQLKGPYWLWRHLHTFAPDGDGTIVQDEVVYRAPGGRLVNKLLVAPDLRRIFTFRQERLGELFAKSLAR